VYLIINQPKMCGIRNITALQKKYASELNRKSTNIWWRYEFVTLGGLKQVFCSSVPKIVGLLYRLLYHNLRLVQTVNVQSKYV